ncbi:lamin tail domain-containing protein [Myxococcota bacterium]|nr:lamin tail domain-containing protein [Myxococcota bacterium]
MQAHPFSLLWLLCPALIGCVEAAGPDVVVLNELCADNNNAWDPSSGGSPDWVELYNTTDATISLAGWSIHEPDDDPIPWPDDAEIGPGEHLVIAAELGQSGFAVPFNLSTSEGFLMLSDADGVPRDWTTWVDLAEDRAWARVGDAGTTWANQSPSAGEENP